MGLDMYLHAERHVFNYDPNDKLLANAISQILGFCNTVDLEKITIQVGYWRKANAIHNWFVTNIQGGKDECDPHDVSFDDLRQLKELCESVLEDPESAPDLLPTTEGCFFGGTEYDTWYFDNVKDTIEIIDKALALENTEWYLSYRSSW